MSNIIVISIIGIIGLLIVLFFIFVPIGLWISSLAANVKISIFNLIGMKLRRVVPSRIVIPLIKARKAGLDLGVNQLEAHYLAGGNVDNVVNALIASERAGIELPFEKAAAIDLAGRDVLEAVKMSVNPKVIETTNVSAVAKDGIELLVKARVTVRADLERLVGGAGEATILARIGEGIVTTVGSAKSHKEVLENPDDISKRVLSKGLDSGTAFEILSIDIADIDVGRNIGAHLQSQDPVHVLVARGEHQDRQILMPAAAQLSTYRQAIITGHHHVQHHQVDMLFVEHYAHLFPVRRARCVVAGFHEVIDNQFTNIPVVIDDKDVINMLHRRLLIKR